MVSFIMVVILSSHLVTLSFSWTTGLGGGYFGRTRPRLIQQRQHHMRPFSSHGVLRAGADIEQPTQEEATAAAADAGDIPLQLARGKVNQIDFCIAPADVSLSRAYGSSVNTSPTTTTNTESAAVAAPVLSLTRALNNASNRAVSRILLARSWPSAEALNLSLRQVAALEKEREQAAAATTSSTTSAAAKCPVPRPILNVLTRKRNTKNTKTSNSDDGALSPQRPTPLGSGRTDAEYVADQLANFRERYGTLPGYGLAQDYLTAVLSLATSGVESDTVPAVLQAGVYDESYKRVLSVLQSVGVVLQVQDPVTGRRKIAEQLIDQDVCLSVLDKIKMRKDGERNKQSSSTDEKAAYSKATNGEQKADTTSNRITKKDLGGILLSKTLSSMTRQLNALANIVERALLFGGDQELLVLAETLDADRAAFVDRWYPGTEKDDDSTSQSLKDEARPGVQFLNCMIQLLRECYNRGIVTSMEPAFPLSQSYANAYERLVASAVELGSGYLKPLPSGATMMMMPKPRTAQEELGRFAVWESTFRQSSPNPDVSSYPDDLVGTWEVRDEIGGETIGISTVILAEEGNVQVKQPLEGLRWRLDPGPTHLDTCTFQVLSSDGTILQYRGFIDRGARLEARFSKRPIRIRGSVMFQMRNGSVDYYKDMLPINYRTGTTKFVATKLDSW